MRTLADFARTVRRLHPRRVRIEPPARPHVPDARRRDAVPEWVACATNRLLAALARTDCPAPDVVDVAPTRFLEDPLFPAAELYWSTPRSGRWGYALGLSAGGTRDRWHAVRYSASGLSRVRIPLEDVV